MPKVLLLYFIIAAHWLGITHRWYWDISYYDKLLHFLGGFWVAMMVNYLLQKRKGDVFKNNRFLKFIFIVGSVLIVGFLWEAQEFLIDTFIFHKTLVVQTSVADTMTDLLADLAGAIGFAIFSS